MSKTAWQGGCAQNGKDCFIYARKLTVTACRQCTGWPISGVHAQRKLCSLCFAAAYQEDFGYPACMCAPMQELLQRSAKEVQGDIADSSQGRCAAMPNTLAMPQDHIRMTDLIAQVLQPENDHDQHLPSA